MKRRDLLKGLAFAPAAALPTIALGQSAATDDVLEALVSELQRLDTDRQLPNANQGEITRRLASTLRVTSAHLHATKFDKRLRDGLNKRIKKNGLGAIEEDIRKDAINRKLEMRGQPRPIIERLSKGDATLSAALAETAYVLEASSLRLAFVGSPPRPLLVQGTGPAKEQECEMYDRMIAFYEWMLSVVGVALPVGPEVIALAAMIVLMIAALRASKWWLGCP